MSTRSSFAKIRKAWADRRGVAEVELALLLPVLLLMGAGVIELGWGFSQNMTLERSIRAGATLAARSPLPLDAAARQRIENVVRTGTTDGTGTPLLDGWSQAGATVSVTEATVTTGGVTVPVVRLGAQVPFTPLIPGLLPAAGLDTFILAVQHEQVHTGS